MFEKITGVVKVGLNCTVKNITKLSLLGRIPNSGSQNQSTAPVRLAFTERIMFNLLAQAATQKIKEIAKGCRVSLVICRLHSAVKFIIPNLHNSPVT